MENIIDTIHLPKRYLNAFELAGYLGKSKWWVYGMVKRRKIPFVQIGRQPRFDVKVIDNWMAKNTIKSVA